MKYFGLIFCTKFFVIISSVHGTRVTNLVRYSTRYWVQNMSNAALSVKSPILSKNILISSTGVVKNCMHAIMRL